MYYFLPAITKDARPAVFERVCAQAIARSADFTSKAAMPLARWIHRGAGSAHAPASANRALSWGPIPAPSAALACLASSGTLARR